MKILLIQVNYNATFRKVFYNIKTLKGGENENIDKKSVTKFKYFIKNILIYLDLYIPLQYITGIATISYMDYMVDLVIG